MEGLFTVLQVDSPGAEDGPDLQLDGGQPVVAGGGRGAQVAVDTVEQALRSINDFYLQRHCILFCLTTI